MKGCELEGLTIQRGRAALIGLQKSSLRTTGEEKESDGSPRGKKINRSERVVVESATRAGMGSFERAILPRRSFRASTGEEASQSRQGGTFTTHSTSSGMRW